MTRRYRVEHSCGLRTRPVILFAEDGDEAVERASEELDCPPSCGSWTAEPLPTAQTNAGKIEGAPRL